MDSLLSLLPQGTQVAVLLDQDLLNGTIATANDSLTVTTYEGQPIRLELQEVHAIGLDIPITCTASGRAISLPLKRGGLVSGTIAYFDPDEPWFVLLNDATFEEPPSKPRPQRRRRDDHLGPLTDADFNCGDDADNTPQKFRAAVVLLDKVLVPVPEQQQAHACHACGQRDPSLN